MKILCDHHSRTLLISTKSFDPVIRSNCLIGVELIVNTKRNIIDHIIFYGYIIIREIMERSDASMCNPLLKLGHGLVSTFQKYVTLIHALNSNKTLQWRHNERNNVSNHQPRDCFLNRLFRCSFHLMTSSWKLRVNGLRAGNSPGTGEFPAQRESNAENVSIWWLHHELLGGRSPSLCIHY